jgi:hypothetical protein
MRRGKIAKKREEGREMTESFSTDSFLIALK